MDRDYWLGRWERGETGWHQTEVEPALIRYFNDLKPTRIFVPLCGKSLDLEWLSARGHTVIGVELSAQACEEFFKERGIHVQVSTHGAFRKYEGGRITLFNGDYFLLTPSDLGPIGALYDRAALIALPPSLRPRYVEHMMHLLNPTNWTQPENQSTFRFLQLVLERTQHDDKGPPHSVPEREVHALYGKHFRIQLLNAETLDAGAKSDNTVEEKIFMMTPLARTGGSDSANFIMKT